MIGSALGPQLAEETYPGDGKDDNFQYSPYKDIRDVRISAESMLSALADKGQLILHDSFESELQLVVCICYQTS